MFQQAYENRYRALGPTNRNTYFAFRNMGQMSLLLGHYDESERIFTHCLDVTLKLQSRVNHYLNCLIWLVNLHLFFGKADEAYDFLQRAHKAAEDYPPKHKEKQSVRLSSCFYFYETRPKQTKSSVSELEDALKQADEYRDAWVGASCQSCPSSIQRSFFACPKCPKYVLRFCHACVARNMPAAFCAHDIRLAMFKPPARLLQETRLALLAQERDWPEYDKYYDAYEEFCTHEQVPDTERIVRKCQRVNGKRRRSVCSGSVTPDRNQSPRRQPPTDGTGYSFRH
ncbi:Aste57867_9861 [Aphanomyces stellatus]|uniref:Aste57867_9861 protein n=1 Tax=Aphanomyces stellatus TaxID=120398 RepID=A0A485KPI9_9STRA|nr:hypothetical protein As57867_009822 [Aphanomyces stellatus]VFT86740.1 Aste57867_9861 [Aphanomyces stellatus]